MAEEEMQRAPPWIDGRTARLMTTQEEEEEEEEEEWGLLQQLLLLAVLLLRRRWQRRSQRSMRQHALALAGLTWPSRYRYHYRCH
eukprot:COSAG02_NODE_18819_length_917_cov_0.614914_2_plen_85_part_00